jgi:aspartate oxidase
VGFEGVVGAEQIEAEGEVVVVNQTSVNAHASHLFQCKVTVSLRERSGKNRMRDTKRAGGYKEKQSNHRCERLTMKSMYLALYMSLTISPTSLR